MSKLSEIKELLSLLNENNIENESTMFSDFLGEYCIIRTYSAGVHCGYVKNIDTKNMAVELNKSRRIWQWKGAFTLSEIAKNGLSSESKLSTTIDKTILLNCCEVIIVKDEVKVKLIGFKDYEPN